MEQAMFTNDNGYGDTYTLTEAVRSVAMESMLASEGYGNLADMLAAMLVVQPVSEQLRVLNAASRRAWRLSEDRPPQMPEEPVHIDRERMEKALAGPRFLVPDGMTAEQFVAFTTEVGRAYELGYKMGREDAAKEGGADGQDH
jgi:hypothetical protein